MSHILQPKHVKLSEKEVATLLKQFNISKAQLPKILSTDAALEDSFSVGDVVKIERSTPDKKAVYYRVVV